ncbi:CDC27 family protein [Sulfurospirillum sp. hDNRA2]|uniref:CDC27 family protein n=1 Tax=Sulfurospirillum sp. hDNRA2 TaxID=3237298 RepID=UPI0020B8CBFA|nr:CDC27 family protein [Sulfurospirillum sp. DNRA8]MCP3650954.1 CDC27 family protein [Sulfurospirillum sp. DNRA8]MCR1809800.1 CDC27 family protein [Sulfurospirillum sp. DNRA8]
MTPNRFLDLEKRCAKLRKKRTMKILSLCLGLFCLTVAVVYAYRPAWFGIHHLKSDTPIVAPVVTKSAETIPTLVSVPPIEAAPLNEVAKPKAKEVLFLGVSGLHSKASLPEKESEEALRALQEERKLVEAFSKEPDFKNAYALAEFYFHLRAYQETILWAQKASTYDTHSPLPRLLYAKAKFHLGYPQEAISSLELFLSYIKSPEVEALLTFYKGQQ